ncbi:MAG: SDR family NAD(P)-dependent oxidoreductase [Halieaceae bacterium]|jgi:NAD(P)-dependent dehydrogenase (short-subunit alcohol dehydrogenase family)|nr:SDR family NAD(P)-dependent oxidoreductase [Halieaceae bacterium]
MVIGANGGIGSALCRHWLNDPAVDEVVAVSRSAAGVLTANPRLRELTTDHTEESIAAAVSRVLADGGLARVVIAIGTLHADDYQPEKSLDALRMQAMAEVYRVNCVLPMLWVAALGRALRRSPDTRIAVLSARVGSITDNRLGGWYSYRSSKAALNMGLRSAAIELARRARGLKLIAYHPGTVDSALSKPFQKNLEPGQLLTPQYSATRLAELMDEHPPDGQLSYLAWDGQSIPW